MPEQLPTIVYELQKVVEGDSFWGEYIKLFASEGSPPFALHLAILVEPYLQFILEGQKTIESRFSMNRCAPYKAIGEGDVVLLKRSGGPILGLCQVADTWFYQLNQKSRGLIKRKFAQALCANDPQFWKDREAASFATLAKLQNVRSLPPINYKKRDRRGWVVLRSRNQKVD